MEDEGAAHCALSGCNARGKMTFRIPWRPARCLGWADKKKPEILNCGRGGAVLQLGGLTHRPSVRSGSAPQLLQRRVSFGSQ